MTLADTVDRWKEAVEEKADDLMEKGAAGTRMKFYDRWMGMCGVDRPEDIDLEDPRIHLEWVICDPTVLFPLTKHDRRPLFDRLTDEEKSLYLYGDPARGIDPYVAIEGKGLAAQIHSAVKQTVSEKAAARRSAKLTKAEKKAAKKKALRDRIRQR